MKLKGTWKWGCMIRELFLLNHYVQFDLNDFLSEQQCVLRNRTESNLSWFQKSNALTWLEFQKSALPSLIIRFFQMFLRIGCLQFGDSFASYQQQQPVLFWGFFAVTVLLFSAPFFFCFLPFSAPFWMELWELSACAAKVVYISMGGETLWNTERENKRAMPVS